MRGAIDFANYSPVPTRRQLAAQRAAGYVRAVVGCSFGEKARRQIAACASGGMEVEAYAWLSAGPGWRVLIDRAVAAIEGTAVRRLWLDCEDPGLTRQRLQEVLAYVEARRPGLTPGIYTSAACWAGIGGDFTRYPLWLAHYVNAPDPAQVPLFGGWRAAAMWQYRGSTTMGGFGPVDLSIILEEERMYSDREIDEKLLRAIAAARDAAERSANSHVGNILRTLGAIGKRLDAIEQRLSAMARK